MYICNLTIVVKAIKSRDIITNGKKSRAQIKLAINITKVEKDEKSNKML